MKPLKWATLVVAVLSLVVLLYGCIKVARFENKPPPVKVDIPGVTVETVTNDADRDYAQRIVAVSACIFVVSLIGFGTLTWMQRKKKPPT
jgi:hypothetical protein